LGNARKRSSCDDSAVQTIIEAGTGSMEWVSEEFADVDLSDRRLDPRLIKTARLLASAPISPIYASGLSTV
jgi:hypothetical protein